MDNSVTVIGGGNGASAAAADLSSRGFRVVWYELPEFESSIAEAMALKGFSVEAAPGSGLASGFVHIDTITTDIEKALAETQLAIVIVPSFAQDTVARTCAPYLRDDHIVVLMPGNFGGCIRFQQVLRQSGCYKNVSLAEAECMVYACRKKNATTVRVGGVKRDLGVAAFPATETDRVLSRFQKFYPTAVKAPDVLVTGLSNVNYILHLPVMLGNISLIENGTDALFYVSGMTPAVGRIIDAMEAERISLRKVGIDLRPLSDILKSYYGGQGATGDTIWEFCRNNPVYSRGKMPKSLNDRYLMEDAPYGLIPMLKLLERVGLPHKSISLVVDTLCLASGIDLYEQARDLEKLGLSTLSVQQLLELVKVGAKSAKA